ncbi:hypothetical protein BKE17_11215 [Enhydrobacter sp. H5]|nr:hypothetical protein BKE17_11215 [Enhydrobacter sp. H5]
MLGHRMIKLGKISQAMIGMLLMGVTVSGIAEDKNGDTIAIDMSELSTTKEEVAVLQVLSEICPPMLNKSQQTGFNTAYNVELKKLMPTISDPRLAVQYLSSQQDYKQILNETRQWTLSYPKAENLELCKDLANSK